MPGEQEIFLNRWQSRSRDRGEAAELVRKGQSTRGRRGGEEGVQGAGTAGAKVLGQERTQPAGAPNRIRRGCREEELARGHS